jgi:hypothetical protein
MDEKVRIAIQAQPEKTGVSTGTTLYPHLSLGAEQRYASKGAYIVRFADATGDSLVGESGWIVP